MSHLRKKYSQELEYMLQEFQKRATAAGWASEESGGSRGVEKAAFFIQHLEDTVSRYWKLSVGASRPKSLCWVGLEGFKRFFGGFIAFDARKEEEESIQKLEEHIFNLLPVNYASQSNLRLNRRQA
jgi:hypothetical protein